MAQGIQYTKFLQGRLLAALDLWPEAAKDPIVFVYAARVHELIAEALRRPVIWPAPVERALQDVRPLTPGVSQALSVWALAVRQRAPQFAFWLGEHLEEFLGNVALAEHGFDAEHIPPHLRWRKFDHFPRNPSYVGADGVTRTPNDGSMSTLAWREVQEYDKSLHPPRRGAPSGPRLWTDEEFKAEVPRHVARLRKDQGQPGVTQKAIAQKMSMTPQNFIAQRTRVGWTLQDVVKLGLT